MSLLEGSNPSPSANECAPGDVAGMSMSNSDLAAELGALGSATLGESGGRAMRARIKATWPGAAIAAPAFPVQCTPGDNLAIHVATTMAPAGSAGTSPLR